MPSVNLVILSFVHPMRLLERTNDASTIDGVPIGMTQEVVNYFKNAGIRVMMSVGGVTYTDAWDEALAANATQLGLNAAEVAARFGVGIEIDYECNSGPNLAGSALCWRVSVITRIGFRMASSCTFHRSHKC